MYLQPSTWEAEPRGSACYIPSPRTVYSTEFQASQVYIARLSPQTSLPPKNRGFNIYDITGRQAVDFKRITPRFESEDHTGRLSSFVDIRNNKGVLDYWLRKYGEGYYKH